MSADGKSTGKSKGRTSRRAEAHLDESVEQDGRLDVNELETIPTMVPREGDGYRVPLSGLVGQELGRIGEPSHGLTEDDLRRINTRKGFFKLLESKAVDIEEVRKTLLYEQELRQLQVELVIPRSLLRGQWFLVPSGVWRTRGTRRSERERTVGGNSTTPLSFPCNTGRRCWMRR